MVSSGGVGGGVQSGADGGEEVFMERLGLVAAAEGEERGEDGDVPDGAFGEKEVADFPVAVLQEACRVVRRHGCLDVAHVAWTIQRFGAARQSRDSGAYWRGRAKVLYGIEAII